MLNGGQERPTEVGKLVGQVEWARSGEEWKWDGAFLAQAIYFRMQSSPEPPTQPPTLLAPFVYIQLTQARGDPGAYKGVKVPPVLEWLYVISWEKA